MLKNIRKLLAGTSQEKEPRAIVTDASFRRNRCLQVNDEVRQAYFEKFGVMLPAGHKFVGLQDDQGRKLQDPVEVQIEYRGETAINHAMNRAKRWLRNNPGKGHKDCPRHIRYAITLLQSIEKAIAEDTQGAPA